MQCWGPEGIDGVTGDKWDKENKACKTMNQKMIKTKNNNVFWLQMTNSMRTQCGGPSLI